MKLVSYKKSRSVAFATKHGKERVVSLPMKSGLGLEVVVPKEIDTDELGTFTGEIERPGTPREVVLQKACLGMEITGLSMGLASEGSFGPHPVIPFVPVDHEMMAFVDDKKGFQVVEQTLAVETNFRHANVASLTELEDFLTRSGFPSHALIVHPNQRNGSNLIFKGLQTIEDVSSAIELCRGQSSDGLTHIETDMRAHMNPTRMKAIRRLAGKLVRRLRSLCPSCSTPGWGMTGVEKGLPCRICRFPTELVKDEIFGCARCDRTDARPRIDGKQFAEPGQCPLCNP